ncbi:unnamed protein product [Rotaria sp. Silwood2]|nr:unnamed protein product [Rotaria sp. Silwood2]CAF3061139.1 unnamed protein product [Rotaria sp. Silwood2]CAF3400335.1 unnamed protein product [Rotaria sp. Silwood2]CAF4287733.1 unnamed protein product [Rotaria sp. Silwood2]CAF4389540.1 unnamed protein product [Rotaria sp. Silwood2]
MVDQINQAIDIVVPWMDKMNDKDDNIEKIINLSGDEINERRPLYQITRKKYLNIIRQQLQANNRILLPTYNICAYYSCELTDMQQKVHEHMTRTGAYRLIMELDQTNPYSLEEFLKKINNEIMKKLNGFLHNKLITYSQWEQMTINQSNSQLNTLYFLPDTRQVGSDKRVKVSFHPMVRCHHHLTMNTSKFLSRLLQPIYNLVTYSNTFNTDADVIDAVEKYTRKGLLRFNTLFTTLHIHDLSTIVPHGQTIDALKRFLDEYVLEKKIEGITVTTIMDLVQLVLENQCIIYENRLYQQIQGGISNSPLTILLANIYIFYWQQDLVRNLHNKNEIFGRCFDEIFLTWNDSEQRLHDILQTLNRQVLNIPITIFISNDVNYLDLNICHLDGNLKIQVVHQLNTEPYALPYVVGHSRHKYHSLIRVALLRATRCYTYVFDFVNELEDIQLSFQYNRFSNDFIIDQIQLFLEEFGVSQMNVHGGEKFYDQSLYDHLRQHVIKYHQREKRLKLKRCRKIVQHQCKHSYYQ